MAWPSFVPGPALWEVPWLPMRRHAGASPWIASAAPREQIRQFPRTLHLCHNHEDHEGKVRQRKLTLGYFSLFPSLSQLRLMQIVNSAQDWELQLVMVLQIIRSRLHQSKQL